MSDSRHLNRRHFLGLTALAAGGVMIPTRLQAQNSVVDAVVRNGKTVSYDAVPWKVLPFPNKEVRLLAGDFKREMDLNANYLSMLPNDRLAHMFRVTAKLPTTAEPLGGWEKPTSQLRGHFSGGHYLSASALLYAATGDTAVKAKADELVAILAECQKSHGNGYLSAFPETLFDRLRDGKPVWAPFYTLHKIMAGHLDMYTHTGNKQALDTLKGMADWVGRWVGPLSDEHMQRVLEVEQGGMLEVLCNLYAVTGTKHYLWIAGRFDHHAFFNPLAGYQDELTGLHANTNIPKVIGAARQYEVTGDHRYHNIADYFWNEVSGRRTFCSGGTSYKEHWLGNPDDLVKDVGQDMEECCCGYNMLKLTRHVYGWTADPRTMDYYERTLFNSRLGTQNSDGLKSYFYPLGRGWWKYYNTPLDSFWCCTGTGAEEFSKFNDSIYYHDKDGIYVNLFIASELRWSEQGIRIRQETKFPAEEGSSLLISATHPVELTLNIRIPYWAIQGGSVKINGKDTPIFAGPSSYLTIRETWKDGDRIDISLPMSLHIECLPGDDTQAAVMYGPLVLAGQLGGQGLNYSNTHSGWNTSPGGHAVSVPVIQTAEKDSTTWVEPIPGEPLTFRTVNQKETIRLIPLYRLRDEHYVVYWRINYMTS